MVQLSAKVVVNNPERRIVVRYWPGKIGNPVSASSNPGLAFSFKVEKMGSGRSLCWRDLKLVFNILGANGSSRFKVQGAI